VLRAALAQLPGHEHGRRPGRNVLIRVDGAGGTADAALTVPTTPHHPGSWNRRPPERIGRTVTPQCQNHPATAPEPLLDDHRRADERSGLAEG
jgi:hypothetical protein